MPARKVEEIITPSLEAMGYRVVRVRLSQGRPSATLQVMIESQQSATSGALDDGGITADDCADISRAVSALLDVEDPITGPYVLEVSSPGIDRPLVSSADYVRFTGFDARVEALDLIDGRKRFKGKLLGVEADEVRIKTDDGTHGIPLSAIARAKLLLTDDLISQTAKPNVQG